MTALDVNRRRITHNQAKEWDAVEMRSAIANSLGAEPLEEIRLKDGAVPPGVLS